MAFASVGSFGTATSTTADTTLALTPTVTLESGNLAVLIVATDQPASQGLTDSGQGYPLSVIESVTDTGSNVWELVGAVSGIGNTAGVQPVSHIFISHISTQLTTSSTITITLIETLSNKACTGWEFTYGGGAVSIEDVRFAADTAGANLISLTLDDLPNREYLFVRADAIESDDDTYTAATNHTDFVTAIADAGTDNNAMSAEGCFRILTGTSSTAAPTYGNRDSASVYVALFEGNPTHPVVISGNRMESSANNLTPDWPAAHRTDDIALLLIESSGGEPATFTSAEGFAAVSDSPQEASGTVLSAFWCRATGSSMTSPTVADPGDHLITKMFLIRYCYNTGDPWNVTAGDTATTDTAISIPGDTTTIDDCLILAATSNDVDAENLITSWANTDLTRFRELFQVSRGDGTGGGIGVAVGRKATAGSYGATTATFALTTTQGRLSIAFRTTADPVGGAATWVGFVSPFGLF